MRVALLCSLVVVAACGNDREPPPAHTDRDPLPTGIRLLTDAQIANAIHDLLGDDLEVPTLATPGAPPHQFIYEEVLSVDAAQLVRYQSAAEAVARQIATRPDPLRCAGDAAPATCVRERSLAFAARAFRRPLDAAERAPLVAILDDGGFALVVEAVLQAPQFLYRSEVSAPRLSAYELAGELGFFLLDSLPDDALWDAARDGSLDDPDVLANEVDRLLELPRVRAHVDDVILDWLGARRILTTYKDAGAFPELDDALRASMFAETRAFVHDVLWRRGGSLRELLTSNRTFLDAALAGTIYGVRGVRAPDGELVEVSLDPRERAGVLTQASLLSILATARSESIIARGAFVQRRLLCEPEPGRPPTAAIAAVAGFTSRLSESQFAYYRAENLYCRNCHRAMDPPGRALHAFDGIGRHRERDTFDQPVDDDAILSIGGERVDVENAPQMARALANSDHVARCVVDQLAHHAFGRALGAMDGTRAHLYQRFGASGLDLVEVFRSIATSPAFRERGDRGVP